MVSAPPAVEAEITDVQVAIQAAVDGTPKKDGLPLLLPLLGDEVLVGEQVVQHVRIEHGYRGELAAELVALDDLAVLLVR